MFHKRDDDLFAGFCVSKSAGGGSSANKIAGLWMRARAHGHSLLLPAGELIGQMVLPVGNVKRVHNFLIILYIWLLSI